MPGKSHHRGLGFFKGVIRKVIRVSKATVAWLWLRYHKLPDGVFRSFVLPGYFRAERIQKPGVEYYRKYDDHYPKYLRYLETGKLYKDKKVCFELSKPHKGKTILEIGFGKGELISALTEEGARCWGIDLSPDAIELCKETLNRRLLPSKEFMPPKLLVGSALDPDLYAGQKFDGVILCETLEHFEPAKIDQLTEIMVRHIKAGGFLLFGSTQHPTTYHPPGHRTYGDHCTRITDKFWRILEKRLGDYFILEYREKGYVKFVRTSVNQDFMPKVSIASHYGTGEWSLSLSRKIVYFVEKYSNLYDLVIKEKRL